MYVTLTLNTFSGKGLCCWLHLQGTRVSWAGKWCDILGAKTRGWEIVWVNGKCWDL